MFGGSENDPEAILDQNLKKTYPKLELNIYNQDRKAAVDSFRCYWQIDTMIKTRNIKLFPLVEGITIPIDDSE